MKTVPRNAGEVCSLNLTETHGRSNELDASRHELVRVACDLGFIYDPARDNRVRRPKHQHARSVGYFLGDSDRETLAWPYSSIPEDRKLVLLQEGSDPGCLGSVLLGVAD